MKESLCWIYIAAMKRHLAALMPFFYTPRMTKAAIIVAHHDDAVLWAGGTVQRMKRTDWDWTVIALCVPDAEKDSYFAEYCQSLGLHPVLRRFRDYQSGDPFRQNARDQMRMELLNAIPDTTFDWVFTHSRSPDGEYGYHANHAEVAQVVTSLVNEKKLCGGKTRLAFFSYAPIYGYGGRATVATRDANFYLQLEYSELLRKCDWCMRAPDVDSSLKELGFPCPNPEAFEGDGLQLPEQFIRGRRRQSL